MNFYALGPIAFLNKLIGKDYRHHMVLAQYLYDNDMKPTDYFMYYRRRCAMRGFHVILDNGAYEGQKVSYEKLLQATLELDPHVVILPDAPHNMGLTLAGGEAFKALLKKHKWKGETMTVVHAEPGNLEQFTHAYMEACKQSPWVGISRLTQDFGASFEISPRLAFIKYLKLEKKYDGSKKHHALGMASGSLKELNMLAGSGLFNSCDSSAPLWRGMCGTKLGELWPDAPFDPTSEMLLGSSMDTATNNWQEVQAACKLT